MDSLNNQLDALRARVSRGKLLEGLELYPGWKVLREELEKMLQSMRRQAVHPQFLGKSVEHAAIVGAHNAIESLLSIIDSSVKGAQAAEEEMKEIEGVIKENRKLGIHTKF